MTSERDIQDVSEAIRQLTMEQAEQHREYMFVLEELRNRTRKIEDMLLPPVYWVA
jgi:hypothetical protein